jgi:hypothetical protein
LPGPDLNEGFSYLDDERQKVGETICSRRHHNYSKAGGSEVLLILEILIRCEKCFESFLDSASQQLPILQPSPSLLRNGPNLVARQLPGQLPREGFIEKDAHRQSGIPGLSPRLPPLALS